MKRQHPRRRGRRSQRGFTLIELMISLVLFSFAVAGVLSVAVSLANGLREHRRFGGVPAEARRAGLDRVQTDDAAGGDRGQQHRDHHLDEREARLVRPTATAPLGA